MTVKNTASSAAIVKRFAELVRNHEAVKELWYTTPPEGVVLWVVTAPTDLDTARELHGLSIMLYDEIPEALFDLHVLNPRDWQDEDAHLDRPLNAIPVPLALAD